jgi:23S rRNA (guanosine2251-2'-O)-methyltransferase
MLVYGKNVLKDIEVKKIRKVYLNENLHNKEIIDYLNKNKIHYFLVNKQQLDRMAIGNHQGVVIDMDDYQYYNLGDIKSEEFVVALDHIEDVHNFGAIIRSCEAAGVKSIIIPKDRSVRVNDIVMKTSCGALDRVKVILVNNMVDALKKLQKDNYFIYSSFMDGDDYKTIDYSGKKVLVIGNEGKGISKVVENITDFRVGIPMSGKVNSLNASVAAGILIFAMK